MGNPITKYLTDYSSADEFCFALRCEACGREIKSNPVRFSRSGVIPISSEKQIVFDALYRREKEQAYEKAAAELKMLVNLCPICHKIVCDHCFMICDDIDMCTACAQRLNEYGEPVLL